MINYIGLAHEYGKIDCIRLVKNFYENELGITFELPSYSMSKRWLFDFTVQELDNWISKYATKISLTSAQNYDLIAFKSKQNVINHFGMFLLPNSILHIEEHNISKVELLSDYWIDSIYAVYRHEQLV